MSLSELIDALAEVVAIVDRQRDEFLSSVNPPTSFEDCEREAFQRRAIIERWRREREEPWRCLCNYIAAEQRDGFVVLNPVEPQHVEAARLAVERFR